VVDRAAPLYVADIATSSPLGSYPRRTRAGIRAFAAAPLRCGDEVVGVLSVGFRDVRALTAQERDLLDLFAALTVALIERVHALHAEQRRADQRQHLAAVLADLAAASDLEPALERLVHTAVGLLGGDQDSAELVLAEALTRQAEAAVERVRTEATRREGAAAQARLDGALLVARTVAHEINNALSPVIGFAELLAMCPSVVGDTNAAAYTKLIAEAAQETAAKVRRLQQIVRLEKAQSPLGEHLSVLDLERSASDE
jgi:signal transduction histidine kinase